jgi:hypothetical protein
MKSKIEEIINTMSVHSGTKPYTLGINQLMVFFDSEEKVLKVIHTYDSIIPTIVESHSTTAFIRTEIGLFRIVIEENKVLLESDVHGTIKITASDGPGLLNKDEIKVLDDVIYINNKKVAMLSTSGSDAVNLVKFAVLKLHQPKIRYDSMTLHYHVATLLFIRDVLGHKKLLVSGSTEELIGYVYNVRDEAHDPTLYATWSYDPTVHHIYFTVVTYYDFTNNYIMLATDITDVTKELLKNDIDLESIVDPYVSISRIEVTNKLTRI